ncbi:unnamed protein product [Cuscuta epithymum]|uniref:F-box domain-containing protein n=1 Tax=Cuscuta epithymum TaxID=186058 RepID=A0AAV0DAZ2_9ASTE|nr:unnamed protein product [Cuscuta epithymum]CAH9124092.1 unnamed protein product [Cuscuta epithymum]
MASRDRISQLPEDILDHILGLLPIQQVAQTAVLSTVWRDLWTTLTQLCFDYDFFEYFDKKYRRDSKYVRKSSGLYVITKVLLQHKGTIRKCVIHLSHAGILTLKSRSFDFDQWLHLLTFKRVEELHLNFDLKAYKLPNCIFSCSTLKNLHLEAFSIEPLNLPRTLLPNLTSLYFVDVDFGPTNVSTYVVDVPMLENLSFRGCENILHLKITARKLCSLAIHGLCDEDDESLRLNLDFKSICILELDSWSLKYVLFESATKGHQLQPHKLNVELLRLSEFRFQRDFKTSSFVRLLCICPKLCRLEITFWGIEDTTKAIDATSRRLIKLRSVVQTYERLLVLKFRFFSGFRSEMLFIKEMLACLPSLETVIFIFHYKYNDDDESYKKHEIMEEVLCFPRASTKAKIVY